MGETKRRVEAKQEEAREVARTGKALVVVAHGKAWVAAWQAGESLREVMAGQGGCQVALCIRAQAGDLVDGFAPESEGYDMGPAPSGDGVYVCDLGLVDDGPSDWGDGSREVLPSIRAWCLATPEEWSHHLKNEWPWEPKDGWSS